MRTIIIREPVPGTHPVEYRARVLSATRKADIKKAATVAKSCLAAGYDQTALYYFGWVTDALDERINGPRASEI